MNRGEVMNHNAETIIKGAISAANPYDRVYKALSCRQYLKKPYVVAVGKAAVPMARAAIAALDGNIAKGILLTKYKHAVEAVSNFEIFEAGHPIPDENSIKATRSILKMTENLSENDTLILLLSGGGSSLFELPLTGLDELKSITAHLLNNAAEIHEINMVRKRLSAVKGGKFALHCRPAKIEVYALSDVLGDNPDTICSGPAYPDSSTSNQALSVIEKYKVPVSKETRNLIFQETPKEIDNSKTVIIGNSKLLCEAAEKAAVKLGYETHILTTELTGEAKEQATRLANITIEYSRVKKKKTALIWGGETTVTVKGKGKGGRNQELSLSAAKTISGYDNIIFFSIGSDGTDGPTDAAGGIVDGSTYALLKKKGIDIDEILNESNSYEALSAADGLIFTGPTGTNLNDLTVALID